MKTIGLLGGMSWESTALYYRAINEMVRERLGGLHSAKIVMHSFDFAEIAAMQSAGDWESAGTTLARAARGLEGAGADCMLLCTNTMHLVADAVQSQISIPLIHIADATAERLKADGSRRPALLATRFTMEKDFYKGRLASRHGIDALVPDQAGRDAVHRVIYEELVVGRIEPASKALYVSEIGKLRAAGADSVIMGCTEITMLIGQGDFDVPVYDTTRIHAEAAVDLALGGR